MKHKRFEENILVDEAYTNYSRVDKNEDKKKSEGIAKHFAETIEYDEKKKWYHQLPQEPPGTSQTVSDSLIEELRKEASSALHGDTMAYETKTNRSGSSDHQWAKTLLNKGAIGDRVAAATILIQDNPVYNLTALRNLINQVKPAKKKDGIVIIDALSELLISELLIPDAKLRPFAAHALAQLDQITSGNKQARRNVLKLWYYEDQLKELYGTYVEALNKFAHDSVEANKEKSVSAMSYLLMHHPEREKMLLSNIINKLGDPAQSVASKVVYHLCQLLFNHPNMKAVVLAEIEKMLFRTNISPRAQYYGICFLNQFYLGKDDSKIADDLIRIYFSFFKANIKKGEIDSRLMSAVLTGVKRATPFAAAPLSQSSAHAAAVYRVAHLAAPRVATHALALLFHASGEGEAADRFYSALYRKLAAPSSDRPSALLLGLVYKALRRDRCIPRVIALTKRILQLCALAPPAQAAGMLFLLSQVLREGNKKDAVRLLWTKRDVKDEEIKEESPPETATEQPTTELDETTESQQETELVKEEEVKQQPKVDLLRGDKKDLLMEDDEEIYVDLKLDEAGQVKPKKRKPTQAVALGWFHAKVKGEAQEGSEETKTDDRKVAASIQMKRTINIDKKVSEYTPHARNPAFAGTEHTAFVELAPLARHFHPTVKMFAEKLANNQLIQYTGDPLKDFSGIRFLDRFVFKNPKKRTETEQQSEGGVKKVRGSHPKFAVRKNYAAKGLRSIPVNSSSYLNEDAKKIPVDERFLYDFLQKRREKQGADSESDSDSDNDSVTSEDFEKYLDSVTGSRAKDDSDEELDFLSEMKRVKQQRGKKGKDDDADDQLGSDDGDDDESGGDDVDDDNDGSDGELNLSGDDDEPALLGDEDELNLEESDEDDKIDVPGRKTGKGKMKLKLKGKDDLGSLFASAEEFSTLLEDTATNKKQGSSQAVSNTDNSSVKQLAWEDKRDKWLKGFNRKMHGAKKGGLKKFNNKKNQNGGFNKMAPKKGGKRKSDGGGAVGGKKKKFNK